MSIQIIFRSSAPTYPPQSLTAKFALKMDGTERRSKFTFRARSLFRGGLLLNFRGVPVFLFLQGGPPPKVVTPLNRVTTPVTPIYRGYYPILSLVGGHGGGPPFTAPDKKESDIPPVETVEFLGMRRKCTWSAPNGGGERVEGVVFIGQLVVQGGPLRSL